MIQMEQKQNRTRRRHNQTTKMTQQADTDREGKELFIPGGTGTQVRNNQGQNWQWDIADEIMGQQKMRENRNTRGDETLKIKEETLK